MVLRPTYNGGAKTKAVRLTDIPLIVRRRRGRALYEAAIADRDLELAMRINAAIEYPSDRVYWVPLEAWEKVLG